MDFDYTLNLVESLKSMKKRGAFLTVKDNDGKVNTMTIGWGNIGYDWERPIFTVLVRESRYTHTLLENAEDFTVSIPLDDKMNKALGFCGSKSGRDLDKFEECKLPMVESKVVKSPTIGNCQMVYECKIVYKQFMDLELLDEEIKKKWYVEEDSKWYKPGDCHTIYYGEIVNCYCNE
ncbi:flavin reductase family protein [Sporanaerobacter acetigenes]|uniref:flavin reductase family protein n=1 Tax=Sporanaerobacter acetigenes TaxID=165813 RepID=UPI0033182EAB